MRSKKILIYVVLCYFIMTASLVFATTMERIDSTGSLSSMLGQSCIVKISTTTQDYYMLYCANRCKESPDCSILFYYDFNKTCELFQLSDSCNQAVNISSNANIWMDRNKYLMQLMNRHMTFHNSSVGPYGEVQTYTVALSGCHNVTAKGARSGRKVKYDKDGCLGAVKGGSFMFNTGDELRVVVGQEGGHTRPNAGFDGSGAGGASFVYTTSGNLLLAAGGAGGVYSAKDSNCSGQVGINAGHSWYGGSQLGQIGYGGENGTTGEIGAPNGNGHDGGVGASWFSSGPPVRVGETWGGRPGHNMSGNFSGGLAPSYSDTDGLFEAHGGFGGGGSGSPDATVYGNGGSGGGYSSGGAGSKQHTGGGGSSFASPIATNVWGITGGNTEAHGSVTFTYTGPTCG